MGTFLSERELDELTAPDNAAFPSPVPLQMVSNGEFNPLPQTEQQRQVEGRLKAHPSPHFVSHRNPGNSPLLTSISANRCISGSSRCPGMFGISS